MKKINPAPQQQMLTNVVLEVLNEYQGEAIVDLDVAQLTSITDHMIICGSTSNRHVKSLANHLIEKVKAKNYPVIGVESDDNKEWMLVDLGDVVVHIMQQASREFYQLEKLWTR